MGLELNDLLRKEGLDPDRVLALRHRPKEPELRKVLPWLAKDRPDLFNAYQATQNPRAEAAMGRASHVAAFIGHAPGKAVFVGLYRQAGARLVTNAELQELEVYKELLRLGGEEDAAFTRTDCLLFDLELMATLADWQGRLVIRWPPPELSWFRWCGNGQMAVEAIMEESAFVRAMPNWQDLNLSWAPYRR